MSEIAARTELTLMLDMEITTCPYCMALLPTAKAQQCLACGWDWHDAQNPVKRGTPEWNRFGINTTQNYVVALCQRNDGDRYYEFRVVDESIGNPEIVLTSETLTGIELLAWAQGGKRDHLRLTTGEQFALDAHGIWLTDSEIRRMRDRSTPWWEGDQSFWVNGIAPLFPPA